MPPILARSEGEGGGEVIDKIGRGAHLPRPKSFSCFRASFLKAREAPLKKRKRSETARPQFWFWIRIRVNSLSANKSILAGEKLEATYSIST